MIRATVKYGSRGEDVKYVQETLNKLGFNAGTADGIYGSGTQKAVMAFQSSKGLVADGIVGPNTYSAFSSSAPTPSNIPSTSIQTMLPTAQMPVASKSVAMSNYMAKVKEFYKNAAFKFGVPAVLVLGAFAYYMSAKPRKA